MVQEVSSVMKHAEDLFQSADQTFNKLLESLNFDPLKDSEDEESAIKEESKDYSLIGESQLYEKVDIARSLIIEDVQENQI
jgi:hypothetical protein